MFGILTILLVALQFTNIPWKAFSWLANDGSEMDTSRLPTHLLVLSGSGIPGESSLIRLWYAAEMAQENPRIPVWMALPCMEGDRNHPTARAYAQELALHGVEVKRCVPRACGTNTRGQAMALAGVLADEGEERANPAYVLVVTSPEHVRRACLAVRRAAKETGLEVIARGVPAFTLSLEDHVQTGDGKMAGNGKVERIQEDSETVAPHVFRYDFWNHCRYTLDAGREGVALLYYWIKGWI